MLANPASGFAITLDAQAGRLSTLRANQHHIRDDEWGLQSAHARVNCPALGLDLALVLGADVDTLHDNPVLIRVAPE